MRTADFDYELDENLIAQVPAEPRDSSRLFVYDRAMGEKTHAHFRDIGNWLRAGDVLVLNETKVIPARLYGKKCGTDTELEFLLLRKLALDRWDVIMKPGKKLKPGQVVAFGSDLRAALLQKKADGVCEVEFAYEGVFENLLEQYGQAPLPPYITQKLEDRSKYQTVYAKEDGSAAAPTAGLHFTPALLDELQARGIQIVHVVLHVGLGTFRPMKEETVEAHIMHSEYYSIAPEAATVINTAKREGRRVIAVGTTSVRTLESAANEDGAVRAESGDTDIFIYPGYRFKTVDAMVTNFHLPKSTLLMLVSAFAGRENMMELYREATRLHYRFFSFGDAMLIV